MLQGMHSAILLTFIKLPFVINNIVLSFVLPHRLPSKVQMSLCVYQSIRCSHSAILLTFIKLPFVINNNVLSFVLPHRLPSKVQMSLCVYQSIRCSHPQSIDVDGNLCKILDYMFNHVCQSLLDTSLCMGVKK